MIKGRAKPKKPRVSKKTKAMIVQKAKGAKVIHQRATVINIIGSHAGMPAGSGMHASSLRTAMQTAGAQRFTKGDAYTRVIPIPSQMPSGVVNAFTAHADAVKQLERSQASQAAELRQVAHQFGAIPAIKQEPESSYANPMYSDSDEGTPTSSPLRRSRSALSVLPMMNPTGGYVDEFRRIIAGLGGESNGGPGKAKLHAELVSLAKAVASMKNDEALEALTRQKKSLAVYTNIRKSLKAALGI